MVEFAPHRLPLVCLLRGKRTKHMEKIMAFNTVSQANAWAIAHPTKNVGAGGPSWSGWCAALMFWAGNFDRSCDTAAEGSYNSGIISTNPSAAPAGAFHWWRMGSEGHVALDLDGGGTRLLMASSKVSNYGTAIGTISWAGYGGAAYAGWSLDFVGQKLADVGTPAAGTGTPSGGISNVDGVTLQKVAQKGGYTGPLDGVPGTNTWIGIQTFMRGYGYTGPIDGAPGVNTWMALQRLAQEGGYTGPIDGVPGTNTYTGLNNWLAGNGTTSPSVPTGPRGVYGIDTGTTQRDLDFNAVRAAGYQFAIVKAGGTNVAPIYVAPHYHDQVTRARSAGLNVGHYWMAGSTDPVGDANFFVDHLYDYRDGDILALDNEKIDDGIFWDDAKTASFMQVVKNRLGRAPFLYTYSAMLIANTWTQTKAVGSKLWIAHYTTPASPNIGSAFPSWAIHQYSSSASINGIPVDVNIARASAFDGLSPVPYGETAPPTGGIVSGGSGTPVTSTQSQGVILQRLAQRGGYTGPLDGAPGANTWKGVQQQLRTLGFYDGPIDGSPGVNTYKGVQLLARAYGYTGPIDGDPGPNTYAGVSAYLDSAGGSAATGSDGQTIQRIAQAGGYTGALDGAPGTNTWKGMQQVLAGYGYVGPVDGEMGSNSWKALQRLAAKGGYTGTVDGVMGVNSWKGVQTVLRGFGYTGPIDGAPGTDTYVALQALAKIGGYTGPSDGVPGPNTWKGIQSLLSGVGYTGPIDGVPGTNTYRSLQALAARGGYNGPIDGDPGPRTYAGLAALLVAGAATATPFPTNPTPVPSSGVSNSAFFEFLYWLEAQAEDWFTSHNDGPNVPELIAQYLRDDVYVGLDWTLLAGPRYGDWVSFVERRATAARRPIVTTYNLPGLSAVAVDHFFATMNGYLHRPRTTRQTGPEFVDIGGWAGDLITTLGDYKKSGQPLGESIDTFGRRVIGGTGANKLSYGLLDFIQDVDGYNVATRWHGQGGMGSIADLTVRAVTDTLVSGENRYATFLRLRFGSQANARTCANQVFSQGATNVDTTLFNGSRTYLLQHPESNGAATSVSEFSVLQLTALAYAWVDVLVSKI
ncbi:MULTISPECIES: GH25 family lysozyme [unclassified Rathayibacter]|uniref:GH25 family lysozyme n=1 Tax=unclassified Rathayibacter TaxID=2609250 RepID=UPI00188B417F|nr:MULTISPECIES: GH25 family lysozyme [unclassified Rathayibacter]MBF4462665.1 hypothetical protein [Rathayibacter sp. VKM Ac-2879]MBF4504079.1 hypothetical protein [Rathayibacter sp. VKM Ac-2878]